MEQISFLFTTRDQASQLLSRQGYHATGRELVAIFGQGNERSNLDAVTAWLDQRQYIARTVSPHVLDQRFQRHLNALVNTSRSRCLVPLRPKPWLPPKVLTEGEVVRLAWAVDLVLSELLGPRKQELIKTGLLVNLAKTNYLPLTAANEALPAFIDQLVSWITWEAPTYVYFPSELTPLLANQLYLFMGQARQAAIDGSCA